MPEDSDKEFEEEEVEMEELDMSMAEDFNLDNAVKPTLVPKATYFCKIFSWKLNLEQMAINVGIQLHNNGDDIMTADGQPVDSQKVFASIWLPKKGDENERTKDGAMTKKQSKINMMSQFFHNLGLDQVKTMSDIKEGIENREWLFDNCKVKITHRTWEGETYNNVKKLEVVEEV